MSLAVTSWFHLDGEGNVISDGLRQKSVSCFRTCQEIKNPPHMHSCIHTPTHPSTHPVFSDFFALRWIFSAITSLPIFALDASILTRVRREAGEGNFEWVSLQPPCRSSRCQQQTSPQSSPPTPQFFCFPLPFTARIHLRFHLHRSMCNFNSCPQPFWPQGFAATLLLLCCRSQSVSLQPQSHAEVWPSRPELRLGQ